MNRLASTVEVPRIGLVVLAAWFGGSVARAQPVSERPPTCEGCHAEAEEDEAIELADGTRISAAFDLSAHQASAHGGAGAELACVDCHRSARLREYPHRKPTAASGRAYREAQASTCQRCHFDAAKDLSGSVHAGEPPEEGPEKPDHPEPTCVDCHGAHEVPAGEPSRESGNRTCGSCHEEAEEVYADSVHGKDRVVEGVDPKVRSEDLPGCIDCHAMHRVEAAQTPAFRAGTHRICAECHGEPERMARYGLSSEVLDTYLDDFHGASNHLYINVGFIPERPIATCADCHGSHDVRTSDPEESAEQARERTLEMCRECHEGAADSFSDAWLSHSDPSLSETPFVWAVLWGYRLAVPAMVAALIVHILLHFHRAAWGAKRRRVASEPREEDEHR